MRKPLLLIFTLLSVASCREQNASRIAVFDPQTTTTTLLMDTAEMDAVAQILVKGGFATQRVTAAKSKTTHFLTPISSTFWQCRAGRRPFGVQPEGFSSPDEGKIYSALQPM